MECYPLELKSGEWVISAPGKEYPQVIVAESLGLNVGDKIVAKDVYNENEEMILEVAGVFSLSQKLVSFNKMISGQGDFRFLYFPCEEEGTVLESVIILL